MAEAKPKPKTSEDLIDILKSIQKKLQVKTANEADKTIKGIEKKVNEMDITKKESIVTDNEQFNYFINNFSNNTLDEANRAKIAKKLLIAYLYINNEP